MGESITFLNIEYLFLQIYYLLTGNHATTIPESFYTFWFVYQIVSVILSVLLIAGIVYSIVRIWQIRKEEAEIYGAVVITQPTSTESGKKWQHVLDGISSDNPKEWRLAILEADVLLDRFVTTMGYRGDTLGEKLKGIEKSDFNTLNEAWEAHKVRNRIAHSGSDFILTQREAQRIIDLYKQVFEEFHFI